MPFFFSVAHSRENGSDRVPIERVRREGSSEHGGSIKKVGRRSHGGWSIHASNIEHDLCSAQNLPAARAMALRSCAAKHTRPHAFIHTHQSLMMTSRTDREFGSLHRADLTETRLQRAFCVFKMKGHVSVWSQMSLRSTCCLELQ